MMAKMDHYSGRMKLAALVCILLAYGCRFGFFLEVHGQTLGMIRTFLYFVLFLGWGISIRQRIIHRQIRHFLIITAALMIFWLLIRSMKYFLPMSETADRYLWYLYYLPMIMIPFLIFLAALSLGKSENYRQPTWTYPLGSAVGMLVLLVLTNDAHHQVFSFPSEVQTDDIFHHEAGYWLVFGCICSLTAASLILFFVKCRRQEKRRVLWSVTVLLALGLAYSVFYLSGATWVRHLLGDMTIMICLLMMGYLELCIACGLIPSNTHYVELMQTCTAKVQMIDSQYQVIMTSHTADHYDQQTILQAASSPIILENGIRLSMKPIHAGYVLWEDDVSELILMDQILEDLHEQLTEGNIALAEEMEMKKQLIQVKEKNHLCDEIHEQAEEKIAQLAQLIDVFSSTSAPEEENYLLIRIIVIGTYLKRRSNLIFLAEEQDTLAAAELYYCLQESLKNLKLYQVEADQAFALKGSLSFQEIEWLYDAFERVLEASLDTLISLFVYTGDGPSINIRIHAEDFAEIHEEGISVIQDEGRERLIRLRMPQQKGVQC